MSEFRAFGNDIMTIVVVVGAISLTIGIISYILVSLNTSLTSISKNATIPNFLSGANMSLINVMILMLIMAGVVMIAAWIIRKFITGITGVIGK